MSAYAAVLTLKIFLMEYTNLSVTNHIPLLTLQTIENVHKDLGSFQIFLERMDGRSRNRMHASLERVAEAMRGFEKDVSSNVVGILSDNEGNISSEFIEEVRLIMEESKKIKQEYYSLLEVEEEEEGGGGGGRVVSKSKMVGFRDELRKLKESIISHWVKYNTFVLTGMIGIGKTTLARAIFEDLDVSGWFDCRVWVTVEYESKFEEITEAILAQVAPDHALMGAEYDHEDRVVRLKESLKGKRYLIVLDDVFTDIHLIDDYIDSTFPDNENGSRVLITTRRKYAVYGCSVPLRLLNKEESWQLLCEKVFGGGSGPPLLEEAGKKIAEKCDGLPLTIVTVAELLLKAEETTESLWNAVAEQKKHRLFIDAYDQISKVLYPSYRELPNEYRLCFLYMGVFPQYYNVPRSKLINLWIVEGLVKPIKGYTIEFLAAHFLENLDSLSVVMVHQRSSSLFQSMVNRDIKTCRLHSSWWNLCQREAKKTSFFRVLDCYDDCFEESVKGHSRLSIHNNVLFSLNDVNMSLVENCAFTAQSLLCLGPYNEYMVPICFGLNLLRRLDALNIRLYDFPMEILELVELKYLAITCNGKLPPSISKLNKSLQYLIVHRHLSIKSSGAIYYLPTEIWDMKSLKHLEVVGWDLQDLGGAFLKNLSTILDVSTSSCNALYRVRNLKKLRIRIELTPDATEPLFCFDHMSLLVKLESLKCVVVNPERKPGVVSGSVASFPCLPFLLKKLSLSGLGYSWKEANKIASLPFLQVLKVQCNGFQGPKWEVDENGFQKLNFLLVEDVDLVELNAANGSFKCLTYLHIKHCYKLIRLGIKHFRDIYMIEVVDCDPLLELDIKMSEVEQLEAPSRLLVNSSWNS